MNIKLYLDSAYLKTASQAGISHEANYNIAKSFIQEAIDEKFKVIMIRPEMVATAKKMITDANSKLDIGTVIDFPGGKSGLANKLEEADQAILDGADDLDFVCNYEAFKNGKIDIVKHEILECTRVGLKNHKVVKWIVEVAALNNQQIIQLSALIKNLVMSNFKEVQFASVYVKSSTGFYQTENNLPNGATPENIVLMLENASPLPVIATGGIRTYEDAEAMIRFGVKRIGTSSAKIIANGQVLRKEY